MGHVQEVLELLPEPRADEIMLRQDAIAAGYTDRDLAKLVRGGHLAKPRRGAYVDGQLWRSLTPEGQHRLLSRSVLRQASTRLVLSHGSALPEFDGPRWGLPRDVVDVTRRDRRAGRYEAGVRQHQGLLLAGDVECRGGVDVTSGTRTAIDITTTATVEQALVAVNHLLHAGHTSMQLIRERYRPMVHHPNTLHTDLVLRLADPRIESVAESRAFYLMWRGSIPAPQPQFEIRNGSVLVAALDFAWPQRKAWLEVDGEAKYVKLRREGESVTDVVLREKRREDLIREWTGWRCVRITWADLSHPHETVRRILRTLAR